MRCLLDVNVIISLLDSDHAFHSRAHKWWGENSPAWASCPITENGVLRIMASPSYCESRPCSIQELVIMLQRFTTSTDHTLWADEVSVLDAQKFEHPRILGNKTLTDLYLLALAVKNKGCLVTFDRAIALSTVKRAKPENLVVL